MDFEKKIDKKFGRITPKMYVPKFLPKKSSGYRWGKIRVNKIDTFDLPDSIVLFMVHKKVTKSGKNEKKSRQNQAKLIQIESIKPW